MLEHKLTLTCRLSRGTNHSNDHLCRQDGDGKRHKQIYTDEHVKLMGSQHVSKMMHCMKHIMSRKTQLISL